MGLLQIGESRKKNGGRMARRLFDPTGEKDQNFPRTVMP